MKKLLFIVNPRAGKTKSSAPLFDAVAALSSAGYLVRVFVTKAGGDARRVAAEWGPDYDTVVCAGGDGTLNETISGLMTLPQRPLLGYLPNGSTNDFAASLHLSSDPRLAALDIAGGKPHPLDIGRHNDPISPTWRPSVPLPAHPTPPPRRRRTRWATSLTFWRGWAIWTPCALTAAALKRTARCLRAILSSAPCATAPPWAVW